MAGKLLQKESVGPAWLGEDVWIPLHPVDLEAGVPQWLTPLGIRSLPPPPLAALRASDPELYLRCSEVGPRAQYQAHQVGQAQVTHDGHEDAHAGCDEVPQGGGLGIHATCAETSAAEWTGLVPLAPTGVGGW